MTKHTSGRPGWAVYTPAALLTLAATFLALNWGALPERWVVHWGLNGPDGWASRTVLDVFGPLGFGMLVCLFLEGVARGVSVAPRWVDPRLTPRGADALARLSGDLVRTLNVSIALMFSLLAIGLPFHGSLGPSLVVGVALMVVLGGTLAGVLRMGLGFKAAVASGELEAIPGHNGVIYRNPDDPRLWVPKLTGIGSTINFGHPWALPTLALFLLGPVLGVGLILTLG